MRLKQSYIFQSSKISYDFSARDFELDYWRAQDESVALEGGRGASQKITLGNDRYVLRHYLRGGLVARLLKDQYLWTTLRRTRPFRENRIVEYACQQGLPVPLVAAYRVDRSGLFYRASIISRFIDNQGTLADVLGRTTMDERNWQALGELIKRFHQVGIFHADLNANNILLGDAHAFYLIDFDKAQMMPKGSLRGEQNVQRLKRSLEKIARQRRQSALPFHYGEDDWRALAAAYADHQS